VTLEAQVFKELPQRRQNCFDCVTEIPDSSEIQRQDADEPVTSVETTGDRGQ